MQALVKGFVLSFGCLSIIACCLDTGGTNSTTSEPIEAPSLGREPTTLLVYDGFENEGAGWSRQTANQQNLESMDTAFARTGGRALRVEVNVKDEWVAGGPRSEILQPRELGYWQEGEEYWIGASVLFPSDYVDDPMQEIFWQLHGALNRDQQRANRDSGGRRNRKNRDEGKRQSSVPFLMQSIGDSIVIKARGLDPVTIKKTKGEWMDFVVHHLLSSREDGITQVYVNGNLLVDGKGIATIPPGDKVYQKFGIYKTGWKRGGDAQSSVSSRELWFDEIRIGGAGSDFAAVSPIAE